MLVIECKKCLLLCKVLERSASAVRGIQVQEVPVEVKKVQVLCKVLRTVSEVQVLGWCNVSSACAVQVFVESASTRSACAVQVESASTRSACAVQVYVKSARSACAVQVYVESARSACAVQVFQVRRSASA